MILLKSCWLVFGSVAHVWSNTEVQGMVSWRVLLCPLHSLLLATGCCAVTHIHPACKALSSGPLPALPALLHFREVYSKYANSAKAKRLRIRSFSVWFCSFEGICFIFRSHHAYRASDALRSVFRIQLKESWSTAKQRVWILYVVEKKDNVLVSKHYEIELIPREN